MQTQRNGQPKNSSLWRCNGCQAWWVCEPIAQPQTWQLIFLADITNPLVGISQCPAWEVSGPDPSVCPDCGQRMVKQTIHHKEIPTPYIALFN